MPRGSPGVPRNRGSIRERIYRGLVPDPSTGCLVWTRALNQGYGVLKVPTGKSGGGKNRYVHRLHWELINGPIPEGFVLDHLCRNRACANLDHLEVVTQRENIGRGNGICAPMIREPGFCGNGHEKTDENVMIIRVCRTCHREAERRKQARRRERGQF